MPQVGSRILVALASRTEVPSDEIATLPVDARKMPLPSSFENEIPGAAADPSAAAICPTTVNNPWIVAAPEFDITELYRVLISIFAFVNPASDEVAAPVT